MRITYINSLIVIFIFSLVTSCSDDNDILNMELGSPQYNLPRGEPGSAEEAIYQIYERYGTYVLYDFDEVEARTKWTGKWYNWYAPVKAGNEAYVKTMVNFIQENLLDGYTDDFVRRNLSYRILLVDTLCTGSIYSSSSRTDIQSNEHLMIVSNVGEAMDSWNEAKWRSFKIALTNAFTLSFYNVASVKPVAFSALKVSKLLADKYLDPLEEYSAEQHSMYLIGYVKWRNLAHGNPVYITPMDDQDFADYITFLTTTPAKELKNVLTRFEKVKERSLALVPYLTKILELDVVATQNKNCPEDKIDNDFFAKI